MPELAASYVVGFITVLLVLGLVLWREARLEKAEAFRILAANLGLVGARWSHSQDNIVPEMAAGENKPLSMMKTLTAAGIGCAFLSWFGLFFFMLILLSLRAVVHKRRRLIVASPLALRRFATAPEVLTAMQAFIDENP